MSGHDLLLRATALLLEKPHVNAGVNAILVHENREKIRCDIYSALWAKGFINLEKRKGNGMLDPHSRENNLLDSITIANTVGTYVSQQNKNTPLSGFFTYVKTQGRAYLEEYAEHYVRLAENTSLLSSTDFRRKLIIEEAQNTTCKLQRFMYLLDNHSFAHVYPILQSRLDAVVEKYMTEHLSMDSSFCQPTTVSQGTARYEPAPPTRRAYHQLIAPTVILTVAGVDPDLDYRTDSIELKPMEGDDDDDISPDALETWEDDPHNLEHYARQLEPATDQPSTNWHLSPIQDPDEVIKIHAIDDSGVYKLPPLHISLNTTPKQ